jgi:hypothetical protein
LVSVVKDWIYWILFITQWGWIKPATGDGASVGKANRKIIKAGQEEMKADINSEAKARQNKVDADEMTRQEQLIEDIKDI